MLFLDFLKIFCHQFKFVIIFPAITLAFRVQLFVFSYSSNQAQMNSSTAYFKNRSKILPGIISENLLMPTSMVLIRDLTLSFSKNLSRTFHPLITIAFFSKQLSSNFSSEISLDFSKFYSRLHTSKYYSNFSNHLRVSFIRDSVKRLLRNAGIQKILQDFIHFF